MLVFYSKMFPVNKPFFSSLANIIRGVCVGGGLSGQSNLHDYKQFSLFKKKKGGREERSFPLKKKLQNHTEEKASIKL